MVNEDIELWFKRIAKKIGIYDIIISTVKACSSTGEYVRTSELLCVQNDPIACPPNQINYFAFTVKSNVSNNNTFNPSFTLVSSGDTWIDIVKTIENCAKNNCYVLFPGISEPLIKPNETFEEAAIRFELNVDKAFDITFFNFVGSSLNSAKWRYNISYQ